MKDGWRVWVLCFLMGLSTSFSLGQDMAVDSTTLDSMAVDSGVQRIVYVSDMSFGKLAPLEVLIDRAIEHAASLNFQNEILSEQRIKYRIERRQWAQFLSLQAQTSYGTGSGLTAIDNGTVVASRVTNQTNLLYNGGVALKINPEYWLNRKDNLRVLEAQMAQTKATKQMLIQQIREIVVERYQAVINSNRLVRLHAHALENSRIEHETTKLFYERGDITISEFDASLRYLSANEAKYEKARGEYHMAYRLLKEICGGNLN
ncbi:MAG: TolC family protein [Bacteroidia bacterium]|nr:TolC family protein [Bacteroidia bacterium]